MDQDKVFSYATLSIVRAMFDNGDILQFTAWLIPSRTKINHPAAYAGPFRDTPSPGLPEPIAVFKIKRK